MPIRVGVINPAETEKSTMQVPEDVVVRDLREAIVEHMGLPMRGQNGQQLRYHLNTRNWEGKLERLDDGATLEENDVEEGDVLQLTVEMVAPDPVSAFLGDRLSILDEIVISQRLLNRKLEDLRNIVERQGDVLQENMTKLGMQKASIEEIMPQMDFQQNPPQISYINFDITFSKVRDRPDCYEIHAASFIGNERLEGKHTSKLSVSRAELEFDYLPNMGIRLRSANAPIDSAKDLGKKLFDFVFAGKVRDCWIHCQDNWGGVDQGIRLRFHLVSTPELIIYPWEYIWSPEDHFFAQRIHTPIVRFVPSVRPPRPFVVKENEPLRMLVLIADSLKDRQLNIPEEERILKESLQDLENRNLLKIDWLKNTTREKLQLALEHSGGPHIIHFIGHGSVDDTGGYLVLEGDHAPKDYLYGEDLAILLSDCRNLQLVMLNTCRGAQPNIDNPFSSIAIELMNHQVPAVLAMQYEITDQNAIRLAASFYNALAYGWSIYEALGRARKSLAVHNAKIESLIPVLYSHSHDGIIFKRTRPNDV